MTPEERELLALAARLRESGEPVSFYDAFAVVRQARRCGELDDEAAKALVALQDAETLTDGGRRVLGDFLHSYAQRQAQERALARRTLERKDTGKTARAKAGARLRVHLCDRPGLDEPWQLVRLDGPATLERLTPARAEAERAEVELVLAKPGRVRLELAEPGVKGKATSRRFELSVVVER